MRQTKFLEKIKTHIMFSDLFPKILPFMSSYRKIWWKPERAQKIWRLREACWINKPTHAQAHAGFRTPTPPTHTRARARARMHTHTRMP